MPNPQDNYLVNPEFLAYWYFRLNGCTTTTNFIIHPDQGGSQRTDLDVLAVRFPYRAELLTSDEPMQDHPSFNSVKKIDIIFAEVKHGLCRLNGPWTDPSQENMHRVLFALGAFESSHVPEVAQALYDFGHYEDDFYRVKLIAIGAKHNSEINPNIEQILWDDILHFIFDRFVMYRNQKAHHGQWDLTGQYLFELASSNALDVFIFTIKESMQRFVDAQNARKIA